MELCQLRRPRCVVRQGLTEGGRMGELHTMLIGEMWYVVRFGRLAVQRPSAKDGWRYAV
jgi:hypothetical protein